MSDTAGLLEAPSSQLPSSASLPSSRLPSGGGNPSDTAVREQRGGPWKTLFRRLRTDTASGMIVNFLTVAVMTLLLRGSSFMRDATLAGALGAGAVLDAFLLALGIASFVALVLSGGMPEAFLPLHAEAREKESDWSAQRLGLQSLASHVLSLLFVASALFLAAPTLIEFMGSGMRPEGRVLATKALRELMPFLVCYGSAAFLATWLQAERAFALGTVAPALGPLGTIGGLLWSLHQPSITAITIGTNIGAALSVVLLGWTLARRLPKEREFWQSCRTIDPAHRRVVGNALPFCLSGAIFSASTLVDSSMASLLPAGSITVLSYAEKTCGVVLGLTAGPAGAVVAPYFARLIARSEWSALRSQVFSVLGVMLVITVPMAVLLFWQAPLVVKILFEHGAFDADATARVSEVLRLSLWQIPFYLCGMILSRLAVCLQATRLMVGLSVASVAINAGMNWVLMRSLGLAGIALSTASVHCFCTITLTIAVIRILRRKQKEGVIA